MQKKVYVQNICSFIKWHINWFFPDRLLLIEAKYKSNSDAILKKGDGALNNNSEPEDDCEDPLEIDDTDQRSGSLVKKDIILPDSASTRISSPIGSVDIFVRKRFKKKASVLWEKLEANPHFKVSPS